MTPKEKAEEMVKKFSILLNYDFVTDLRWHDPNSEERNRKVKKDAKGTNAIYQQLLILDRHCANSRY